MRKTDPSEVNVDQLRRLGYERTDVSLPTLTRWIIFLFGFVAFCAVSGWIIYKVFVPEIGVESKGGAEFESKIAKGNPVVQGLPKRDIREFHEREERVVTSYGWADKAAGTVHIPLDKAMEDVAAHGLPSREAGPIPSTTPTPAPPLGGGTATPPGQPGGGVPAQSPATGNGVNPAGPAGTSHVDPNAAAPGTNATEARTPPPTGMQAPTPR